MSRTRRSVDRMLLLVVIALLGLGLIAFFSASLGLLARGTVSVPSILFNHLALGLGLGSVALIAASRIHYRIWKRWAPYLYGASVFLTALVFIPALSLTAGGASRWVAIGGFSFQPSEALKIGTILMLAAFFAKYQNKIGTWQWGLGGFLAILALPSIVLLLQPDTGTFGVIAAAGGAMFVAAGARWKQIAALFGIGLLLLASVAFMRPYVLDRFMTFLDPSASPDAAGWQIQQSLIAIGSGGFTGRGFGQSIQKFSYLPEPMTDSIYAVVGEEFGFIGAGIILGLFLALAARGFSIAVRAPDFFGAILAVGIMTYLVGQAFLNIGAMLGVLPLTGIPLVFISHGGTAMMVALGAVGILLNISRYAKKTGE